MHFLSQPISIFNKFISKKWMEYFVMVNKTSTMLL